MCSLNKEHGDNFITNCLKYEGIECCACCYERDDCEDITLNSLKQYDNFKEDKTIEIKLSKNQIYCALLHIGEAKQLLQKEYVEQVNLVNYTIVCNWDGIYILDGASLVKYIKIEELDYSKLDLKVVNN